ncbi:MAG: GEVED domain-containing protein [Bacteroidales bacterium]
MKKLFFSTILGLFGLLSYGQSTATFTSSGTWTCPAGVTSVTVECWGGGGGGGYGISTKGAAGGGGGGGAYASSVVSVTPGNSYTITIGAGGSGGTTGGVAATAGGATSFNTTSVIAAGGNAGTGVTTNSNGAAGAGGTVASSTGTTKYAGGAGAAGVSGTAATCGGGGGGAGASTSAAGASASFRIGGTGTAPGGSGGSGADNASGTSGSTYGGGGAGGHRNNNNRAGGAGANGLVTISYVLPPENKVPATGNNSYTTCSDHIYDSGGSTGSYSANSDGYSVIYPSTAGSLVQLTGTYYTESTYDYVYIYNGIGTTGTLLFTGSASSSTSIGTITSSDPSGALTVRFKSDGSTQNSGFDFTISCVIACAQPATQATIGAYTNNVSPGTSLTVNWTNGSGNSRLVVARLTATAGVDPISGLTYTANTAFGSGSTTGTGNFVVYNGTGTSVTVTGLTSGTNYTFTVYEFSNTGPCYKIPGSSSSVFTWSPPAAPCLSSVAINCGTTYSGTLATSGSDWSTYSSCTYSEAGDEIVYTFVPTVTSDYTFTTTTTTGDPDFFLMSSCSNTATNLTGGCWSTGNKTVTLTAGTTYYLIIDNYSSSSSAGYTVSIICPCSGTPTPGNTLASSNPVCAGVAFTLSLSGTLSGDGYTYQWQSSPDNTTWTDIAGATSSTYTATQNAATYYRCLVTCTNSSLFAYSTAVYVTLNPPLSCYCVNTNTVNTSYYISNFTATGTNTINNTTGFSTNGYGDYTAMSVTQMQNSSVSFSITETGGTMTFGIWVDWNDNGNFSDSGEEMFTCSYNSTISGSFTVPITAAAGCHRMRVVGNELGTAAACTGSNYTECEDYEICVTALPNCSGTPIGGTTTASSTACGHTGAISVTGSTQASGLTYQWYSSPTGGAPWTPITGATGATYTPSVTGLYYYREIKCTASGNIANSSSLQYITSSPSNDECVNATPLTVNSGATCTSVTAGTVNCATASAQTNSCSGTADDDVWFSFVATNASHTISLLNIAGSTTDMYHSVYSGTCGSLTSIKCNDADVSTVTGLTAGATYYVRVYSYGSTAGQTTTFNICVSTSNIVSVVGSSTCENAIAFCASNDSPGVDFEITDDLIDEPVGQCSYMQNPSWWYMQISQNGDLDMTIASSCGDVDFACYGPFSNVTCLPADLTNTSPSELVSNPEYHYTYNPTSLTPTTSTEIPLCEVSTLYSPSGNLVDFAGSISATEYLQIRNAVVGQYYIVLIGNYKQCAGTVSFNQTNFGAAGAGAADCDIVTQCNITSITATTTVTGSTYTVSGNINFIDPPASGTLKICDGTVCQTFTAPFTSPQAYSLTGLIPDGLQHQLTATFSSATVNCEKISNYTSPPSTLPVSLLNLYANCQNSTAAVYWQTASETNNDHFVIEKRNSNNEFYEIGRIDGAGNSNSLIDYMFIDKNLLPGDNYYRLSQIDFDGTKTIYPTIALNCDNHTEVLPTMQVYPNPFVDEVNVVIQNLDEGEFTLEIINELGKVVFQKKCIASSSEFRTLLNLYNLQPAVYNLQCRSQKNVLTIRVIKK